MGFAPVVALVLVLVLRGKEDTVGESFSSFTGRWGRLSLAVVVGFGTFLKLSVFRTCPREGVLGERGIWAAPAVPCGGV
jgi:hypothetical protein